MLFINYAENVKPISGMYKLLKKTQLLLPQDLDTLHFSEADSECPSTPSPPKKIFLLRSSAPLHNRVALIPGVGVAGVDSFPIF